MLKCYFACLMMLLTSSVAYAQITVAENPVASGSFAEASVKLTTGQSVVWLIVPEPTKSIETETSVYFNGPAGTYTVMGIIFSSDAGGKIIAKKHTTKVVIGSVVPVPPAPPPKPADPIDPFILSLQAAYTSEAATDKATSVSKLASLYRMAAKNTVNDPAITTHTQLFTTMKIASESMLPATAIPAVRKVIGTRLTPQFTATTVLNRVKLASEFNAVADALGSLK